MWGDYTSNREAVNPHNGTYNFNYPSRPIPAYPLYTLGEDMFDYEQRPSIKYANEYDKIEWDSKKESSDAAANKGREQESVCNKMCIGKEGREAKRENG